MHFVRPAFAQHPTRFGRAPVRSSYDGGAVGSSVVDDVKLFAGTFVAGFLFVSILIG